MPEARWEPRQPKGGNYSLTWRGFNSNTYSAEGCGLDISSCGVGIECPTELKAGSIVFVQARDGSFEATCEVVHSTRKGAKFHIGLEVRGEAPEAERPPVQKPLDTEPDHYETLQISPKADLQTVHRVFRIMALRFHPDNPETGDVEQFLRMKKAYAVLSDPERRAEYDAILDKKRDDGPKPIFGLKDMGFPREYLSFTLWYLRAKDFVTVADNSDYALTAGGADFVEKKALRHEIVGKLLNPAMRMQRSAKAKARPKTPIPPPRRFLTA